MTTTIISMMARRRALINAVTFLLLLTTNIFVVAARDEKNDDDNNNVNVVQKKSRATTTVVLPLVRRRRRIILLPNTISSSRSLRRQLLLEEEEQEGQKNNGAAALMMERRKVSVFEKSRRGYTGELFVTLATGPLGTQQQNHDVLLDTGSSPLALPHVTCTTCVQLHSASRTTNTKPPLQMYIPSIASSSMKCPVRAPQGSSSMGFIRLPLASLWTDEQQHEEDVWWQQFTQEDPPAAPKEETEGEPAEPSTNDDETSMVQQQCTSDVSFIDGSGYQAMLFRETVSIGKLVAHNVTVEGITRWNANMPLGGILGLAPSSMHTRRRSIAPSAKESNLSLLDALLQTGTLRENAFTVCLSPSKNGTLILGAMPTSLLKSAWFVPYDDQFGLYEVDIARIRIGNTTVFVKQPLEPPPPPPPPPRWPRRQLDNTKPPAIVVGVLDSGSNSIVMPRNIKNAFAKAFQREVCLTWPRRWRSGGVATFACSSESNLQFLFDGYVLSGKASQYVDDLPPLTLELEGGRNLHVPATSYLVEMDDEGTQRALSIVDIESAATRAMIILGAPMMENYAVLFERQEKRVGFVWQPNCPSS